MSTDGQYLKGSPQGRPRISNIAQRISRVSTQKQCREEKFRRCGNSDSPGTLELLQPNLLRVIKR